MRLKNLTIEKKVNKENSKGKFPYLLVVVILAFLLIGVFSEEVSINPPNETRPAIALRPPSLSYPLGTDAYGRCVFSRVLLGFKTTMVPAILLVLATCLIGTFLGLIGGFYGGIIDSFLMRVTDIFMAFPPLLLAIFIAGALGAGIKNASLALVLISWTNYARIIRSFVLTDKDKLYIRAAKISGESDLRILFYHILPNSFSLLIATISLNISSMMVSLAGLSFLGLGSALPQAERGSMISENISYIQTAPRTVLGPSICLILCSGAFNFLADKYKNNLS